MSIIKTTADVTVIQVYGERPISNTGSAGAANLVALTPVPGMTASTVQEAIAELTPKTKTFTQTDLTVANLLVYLHGLSASPSTVEVLDNNNSQIIPDNIQVSDTAVTVDLTSFVPIDGTWTLKISL